MKLAGICLETSNVQRLVDFYSKVLCLEAEGNDKHSVLMERALQFLILEI
jgi:catechol-2,3-dioxygenase